MDGLDFQATFLVFSFFSFSSFVSIVDFLFPRFYFSPVKLQVGYRITS